MAKTGDTGSFTLTSLAASAPIAAGVANYLHVRSATGDIRIRLFSNNKEFESHAAGHNYTLTDRVFDKFIIEDMSGSNNTIRIWYGPGKYSPPGQDNVNVGNTVDVNLVNGSVTVNQSLPNEFLALPDVMAGAAVGTLAAADSESLEVLVSIPQSESFGVRIGEAANVGVTRGHYMGPGDARIFSLSNHELSIIRESAATGDVRVTVAKLNRVP